MFIGREQYFFLCLRLLLEQMRYFPKGKYDDGLDALEMVVQVAAAKRRTATVTIVGGDRDDWYGDYHRNFGWPPIWQKEG